MKTAARQLPDKGAAAEHLAAGALTALGLAAAVWLGVASTGGFYHDDDVNHYLFAEKAWSSLLHRWHTWGRPGYTVPTMVVAHFFGLPGCRVFSAVQTAVVALLAYLIARRMGAGRAAVAAPVLVWAQPLTTTLAATTLTETPAAMYLALAVWLLMRGNVVLGAGCASLMFVTRYETAALAPVFLLAAGLAPQATPGRRWQRVLAAAVALSWAPAGYVAVGWFHNLPPEASPVYMFANEYTAQYGRGPWGQYLELWAVACGVGVLGLAAAGVVGTGRRCLLPAGLAAGLVGLHAVLYRFGLFASGGYPRFLVVESGLVGALAAAGVGALARPKRALAAVAAAAVMARYASLLEEKAYLLGPAAPADLPLAAMKLAATVLLVAALAAYAVLLFVRSRPLRAGLGWTVLAVAAAAAAFQARLQIRPLWPEYDPHRIACRQAVEDIARSAFRDAPALGAHVLVGLIRSNTVVGGSPGEEIQMWQAAPPGTLFFWDNKYTGARTPDHPLGELYDRLARRGDSVYFHRFDGALVEVFVRRADGATAPARQPAGAP